MNGAKAANPAKAMIPAGAAQAKYMKPVCVTREASAWESFSWIPLISSKETRRKSPANANQCHLK
jgi:hypothetical protein